MTNREFIDLMSNEEFADILLNNDILNAVLLSPIFSNRICATSVSEILKMIVQWLDSEVENS